MSRTELGRKTAYDNISVGNAISSQERTIAGALPPAKIVGGGEGSTSALAPGHSMISVGTDYPTGNIPDDIQVAVVTLAIENVAVGG